MAGIYTGKMLLKMATYALLVGMEEIPVLGAVVKIGRGCWEILRDAQDQATPDERIAQLEQAAAVTPAEAIAVATEAIAEARQQGQVIAAPLAEAVADLIAVMPAQIRERTRATLSQARRLGTKAVTVLPVTAQFQDADREAFYTSLFPQRRPQFKTGDPLPNYNNKWALESLIGAGGFGEVWLARHRRMQSRPPMAIKFCQDATSAKLLRDEANKLDALCAKLPAGTAHVVALLDFQFSTAPYWLAMEYVNGGTLESRMRLGPMTWPAAWELFAPLLEGMARVHNLNIVHRDLKPANILLANGITPRIADFGIGKIIAARDAATHRTTRSFTVRGSGSLGYMSPEQEDGILDAHPTDNVYALGVLLSANVSRTHGIPTLPRPCTKTHRPRCGQKRNHPLRIHAQRRTHRQCPGTIGTTGTSIYTCITTTRTSFTASTDANTSIGTTSITSYRLHPRLACQARTGPATTHC